MEPFVPSVKLWQSFAGAELRRYRPLALVASCYVWKGVTTKVLKKRRRYHANSTTNWRERLTQFLEMVKRILHTIDVAEILGSLFTPSAHLSPYMDVLPCIIKMAT
jgi:hypothetical protein